jgi:hypothetical protein
MKSRIFSFSSLLMLISVIIVFIVTLLVTEPFLLYYNQQIGFSVGFEYFKGFLSYPGGVSNYLADFISQFFKFNTVGSLLIVLVATIQGLIAVYLFNKIAGKTKFSYAAFALILVTGVVLLSDYRYPYYATVRLLMAFVFTWAFCFINNKFSKYIYYIWPVLAVLLFYVASGSATLVFGISSALLLAGTGKDKKALVALPVFIFISILIPLISYKFVFPTTLTNLFRLTEVKPPEMLAYSIFYLLFAYYILLPVILLAANFSEKFNVGGRQASTKLSAKKKVKRNLTGRIPFAEIARFLVIGALGYFLFWKSFDPFKKKLVYLDYYAQHENWDEILKVAETVKVYDFRVNYHVNRAYANLGILPEQLFNYPQLLGSNGIFLDTSSRNGSFTMPISDLYFDLGFMSESLRWAFEAQTLLPNSPRILERIIEIYVINERYELAAKFLNVLEKNMLYGDWVKKYKDFITNPETTKNDQKIVEKRKFTPRKEVVNLDPLDNLKLLVDTNHNNRLAYDYLLAVCILDGYSDEFLKYVSHYSYYGIKTLPNSWGETLSFLIVKNKSVPGFVTNETVSAECINRMKAFNEEMKKYGNNTEQAKIATRQAFENSYWYYLLFLNPKVTNALNNKSLIK